MSSALPARPSGVWSMKTLTRSGLPARDLFVQRGFDEARADRIGAHAVLAEFGGERLGEAEHAVLGGGVGRRTRRAQMHEGLDRADIDDAPLAGAQGARNACVTLNTPVRLMAMMSSQSLITASAAPSMPLRRAMPALLTRIETCPTVSAIFFATATQSSRLVTSSTELSALPPACRGFPAPLRPPPSRSCRAAPPARPPWHSLPRSRVRFRKQHL